MAKWLLRIVAALLGIVALIAIGGYFALKRDDIPYQTLATTYESPVSLYVDLPSGVHMHYRDQGNANGPTLLLIHGFAASLHTWEKWVALLGDKYRLVSIDLPGHGLTSAPAGYRPSMQGYAGIVAEFARAQNLQSFSLAGSSMGGHVAWEYALAHPGQVNALILVDAAGWPESAASAPNTETPLIFKLLANPTARALIRDLDISSVVRPGLRAAFPSDPALADDAMVARYVDLSRAPGHRAVLLALLTGERTHASPQRLAALTLPVQIQHGSRDVVVPVARAHLFKAAIPHADLVVFDGIGHVPQEEIPEASAAAARAFLSAIAARTPS
jgi:pimeloyl-ACP methyl ester carboxylesterase